MERINAVTFAPFCARGTFEKEETRQSLKLMKEKTGANYVIFAPNGMQKTAFSEEIDYRTDRNVTDEELIAMIGYAKELGLNVALKPTANCADGTWRAHINFLMKMWCVNRSGAIGLPLTGHFRNTMPDLRSSAEWICLLQAARWCRPSDAKRNGGK